MKFPWRERRRLVALWAIEGCIAAGAVVTLARGGGPGDMVSTIGFLVLCVVALTVPGELLGRAMSALSWNFARRRLALQLYLALAAAAVAAALGAAHGWAAIVAILLTGNALLTLELDARGATDVDPGAGHDGR